MRETVRSKFRSGAARHAFDGFKGSMRPWYSKLLNMTQVELAARGVCHKGNPLTAPNSSTFYSDYKGNPLTAPNSSTFYSDSGRR